MEFSGEKCFRTKSNLFAVKCFRIFQPKIPKENTLQRALFHQLSNCVDSKCLAAIEKKTSLDIKSAEIPMAYQKRTHLARSSNFKLVTLRKSLSLHIFKWWQSSWKSVQRRIENGSAWERERDREFQRPLWFTELWKHSTFTNNTNKCKLNKMEW